MSRPSVLIVDDEESIRVFADRALTAAGYDPHTAASGPEALRLIETHGRPFDVFVIDLAMPLMLGTDLAQQIRRTNPHAKILYFTGFADRLFDEKPRLWQDEAFIEKPTELEGFLEAVSLLLFDHTKGPQAPAA
jgi:two-component system cell cycle sensor histidine kinase/response regulator CckA